jgi:hypothetical protein
VNEHLKPFADHPYFSRAVVEVDEIIPSASRPIELDDVRALMVLAWLRGAAWQSHDTN